MRMRKDSAWEADGNRRRPGSPRFHLVGFASVMTTRVETYA